jgi:hypothetical protein
LARVSEAFSSTIFGAVIAMVCFTALFIDSFIMGKRRWQDVFQW